MGYLLGLLFDSAEGRKTFLRKVGRFLPGLHVVTSKRIVLFIVIAVGTLNPTLQAGICGIYPATLRNQR
jgi:hypothetical protein